MGLSDVGWPDVPLVCMETKGADCFNLSLRAKRRVKLEKITSVATSLGCAECDPQLLKLAREKGGRLIVSRVVEDGQAVRACLR